MSLPTHIGKYQIRRELGQGAMGKVYEGFDPVIERRVAIKTILSHYITDSPSDSAATRFRREAQAGGRLQHPGIVAVYDFGDVDGMAYMVMEYLEGEDLRQLLRRKPRLELIDVYGLTRQLLMALDYSHRNGVVHRDLKPANLMVLDGTKLKVMDFGIARIESASITQVGSVLGTPTHMAPEQLMGQPADGRADLWSSGVILYQMLTGHSPFAAETPAAVMHNVMQAEPMLPSSLVPGIAPAFDAVVARALAKRPADRFQSAHEFSAALLAAFRGRPAAEAVPPAPPLAERTLSPEQTARYERTGTIGARKQLEPLSLSSTLPAQTLAEIEASLTRFIGPLAKQLVRQSAAQVRHVDEFYAVLADNIPPGSERDAFLSRIRRLDVGSSSASNPPVTVPPGTFGSAARPAGFDANTLARCEKELARHVGPLARVLIKRAANDSGDLADLYRKLAQHIDAKADREAFLNAMR